MNKIAAYIRASSREQGNGHGLGAQRAKIQQWCDARGANDVQWYEDTASGGAPDRPGLQNMVHQLQTEGRDAVVVVQANRLFPSLKDLIAFIGDTLDPCDTALVSVTEQFDTSAASDRLFLQMVGSFLEFDAPPLAGGRRNDPRPVAQEGGGKGVEAPLGCDKKASGEPARSGWTETVRWILQMREEGHSLRAIAETLNTAGVQASRGGDWHAAAVQNVLEDEGRVTGPELGSDKTVTRAAGRQKGGG